MEENKVESTNNIIEEKIKNINSLDEVTLSNTVDMMNSDNYIERFIAEYMQAKIRYNNLHKMLVKYEADTLEFKPKTPLTVLMNQKSYMAQYIKVLEIRAEIEGITLPNM